jgi:hypothetical protein
LFNRNPQEIAWTNGDLPIKRMAISGGARFPAGIASAPLTIATFFPPVSANDRVVACGTPRPPV